MKDRPTSVWLREYEDQIEKIAKERETTKSSMVRLAVKEFIQRNKE